MAQGRRQRTARWILVAILGGTASIATSATASAAPAPLLPMSSQMVSADALPTVQVDGVVWSQVVVGNTVFVGGRFNNARPAGAAAGTSLTPRSNLLAYNITTGNLITSFAPSLNGQVLSVAASPDGSRVYAVGDFTTANGLARSRVAAFNPATGAVITSFNPVGVTYQGRAVVATNATVYVGGGFQGAGGTVRNRLAAFRASDGALLAWNPNADYNVWALAMSADGSAVFAGGSFQNVGGQPNYGLAKIDATTGAVMPWSATNTVRNAGNTAGVTSLSVGNGNVYGTTWHYGPGGNLEGTFKASVSTGVVEWVTDCHGDNYSAFLQRGVVYSIGHAHYCGNMGGGFPQYPTWRFQYAHAWTEAAGGEILNDVHGYPNWHGVKPGPSMINWLPELSIGNVTGQYQAGWHVTGNDEYVVVGGEFPRVNGVGQQGLVRFRMRANAPRTQGPRFANGQLVPTLVPTSPTSVRVTWLAGFDRDDLSLRYEVYRTGEAAPRRVIDANSNWWTLPSLGFVDTGLTAGAQYTYRIVVRDSDNNVVNGASASVTMPSSVTTNAYANRVRLDGARIYWPMNETSGSTLTDRAGVTDGVAGSGVTRNRPGAVVGDTAIGMSENDSSRSYAAGAETAPDVFSAQLWIRTTSGRGGRLLGFSDLQSGGSGHRDRHIYMDNSGRVIFGVRAQNNQARTVTSPLPYNNGQWHQVTATMSPAGMRLYVDRTLVASRNDTNAGEAYVGYWRLGGDSLGGWTSVPSTVNFTGDVDEVAIYPTALDLGQITAQFAAASTGGTNQVPTASFTSSTNGLTLSVNGSGSSDPGGSIASYAWNWGDGTPAGSGVMASHPYATAGTYNVTLTVTDNLGATNAVTRAVTVSSTNTPPTASFTSSTNGLTLSVNGSGSSDPGGSIATYAWNWGDGTPAGSGVMASHPYATAGTYNVTLTVTDNLGATNAVTRAVTVSSTNTPPTASFTSSTNGLTLSVNGSGSSDPGGSIATYAWNWGDGTPAGSGVMASHPYATAGTYNVTLTVTDNLGATNAVTQAINVSGAVQPLASDTFNRVETNGFGTAVNGGPWTVVGNAPNRSVDGAAARMVLNAGTGAEGYLNMVSAAGVDALVDVSFDKVGTGGGIYQSLVTRRIGSSDYRFKVRVVQNQVTVYLVQNINGTETVLSWQNVAGLQYQPNQVLHLRLRVTGAGTTTLQGKVWVDAQAEPAAWNLTATDATPALQNPGAVGLWAYMSSSATNSPVTARFDNLMVVASG